MFLGFVRIHSWENYEPKPGPILGHHGVERKKWMKLAAAYKELLVTYAHKTGRTMGTHSEQVHTDELPLAGHYPY